MKSAISYAQIEPQESSYIIQQVWPDEKTNTALNTDINSEQKLQNVVQKSVQRNGINLCQWYAVFWHPSYVFMDVWQWITSQS